MNLRIAACINAHTHPDLIIVRSSADPDIMGLLRWRAPGSHAGMSPPVGQGQSAGVLPAGRVVLASRLATSARCPEFACALRSGTSAGTFDRCTRMGGGSAEGWCGGARKALGLRGTLRGRMVLGGADPGSSPLACASVLAGQGLYLGRGNRPAGHGKEKVYGSIP